MKQSVLIFVFSGTLVARIVEIYQFMTKQFQNCYPVGIRHFYVREKKYAGLIGGVER